MKFAIFAIFAMCCAVSVADVASGKVGQTYFPTEIATNGVTAVVADAPDGRCEATTKSGNRCKRKAVKDERYCRQHLKIKGEKKK